MFCILLDGQKIAKKLSTQITKETKKLKALLAEYNACRAFDGEAFVTFEDIVDVSKVQTVLATSPVFCHEDERRETINLYLTWMRAEEEIDLLSSEIDRVYDYYLDKMNCIERVSSELCQTDGAFHKGAVALLWKLKKDTALMIKNCLNCIQQKDNIADSSFDSDSDSDTDYDSDE